MADKDVEYWQQMKRFFIAKRDEQADKKRTTSTAPARISYQENMKRTGRTLAADSGIVSRFKPAKYIKPQFDKLFSKLNALWTREGGGNSYNSTASTAQGSEYFASPAVARTMLWQERWEHRANIATYNIIYRSDPRAFKSIQMYAQEATRGGVTITISSKNKESLISKLKMVIYQNFQLRTLQTGLML